MKISRKMKSKNWETSLLEKGAAMTTTHILLEMLLNAGHRKKLNTNKPMKTSAVTRRGNQTLTIRNGHKRKSSKKGIGFFYRTPAREPGKEKNWILILRVPSLSSESQT
ncbi:hypothetical protein ACOMHN_029014 [Nucella lapillus]